MNTREAAEILAKRTYSVGVYGDRSVSPIVVSQIAREWLELTKVQERKPKRTIWQRFFFAKTSTEQGES